MPDQFEQDLWDFSLTVYGHEGVPEECLALQEVFGIDVNLLLVCAYLGAAHGMTLPGADIIDASNAVRSWHTNVVVRLREVRRALRAWEGDRDSPFAVEAHHLRNKVKAAELESERIQQSILAQWAIPRLSGWSCGRADDAVRNNVIGLLETYGANDQQSLPARLINAALTTASNPAKTA